MKAVRRDPQQRYASADALADDLRRYLRGEPVAARQGNRAYLARKFVERHRLALGVGSLLVLGLAATAFTWRWQRDAVVRERDRAEQVTGFLLDLFKEADPYVSRGDPMPVTTLVQRGAQRLQERLDLDPATRAGLLLSLVEVQVRLGDRAQALTTVQATEALVERWPQAPLDLRARSKSQLGYALMHVQRLDEAQVALDAALALVRQTGDALAQGKVQEELATVALLRGQHEQAWNLARQTLDLRLASVGASDLDAATAKATPNDAYARLAYAAHLSCRVADARGEYALAADLCSKTIALKQKAFAPDHPSIGITLGELGDALAGLGRWRDALEAHQRGIAVLARTFGADDINVAYTHLNMSVDLRHLRRLDEAEREVQEALRGFGTNPHPPAQAETDAMDAAAEVAYARGDFALALQRDRDLAARRHAASKPDALAVGKSAGRVGASLFRLGKHDEAAAQWREASDALPATAPVAERALARLGLAWIALEHGDAPRAASEAAAIVTELEAVGADTSGLASALFLRARALPAGERPAARELAQRALGLVDAGERELVAASDISAWLAESATPSSQHR